MTHQEAVDLATRIRREANTSVRTVLGRTNGKWLVHVIDKDARTSTNVASEGAWRMSPLNKANRPPRPRKSRKSDQALADEATVREGLDTVYSPED